MTTNNDQTKKSIPTISIDNNNEKIDIIGKITGEFGRWQLRTVFLIFLTKIPSSWFMACIIFTAPAPRHGEYFCQPSSSSTSSSGIIQNFQQNSTLLETSMINWNHYIKNNKTDWIQISHPLVEDSYAKEYVVDFCNVYSDSEEHVTRYIYFSEQSQPWEELMVKRNQSNVVPCNSFVHDAEYKSIITDYNLVCSRDILVATTQFFHLFGVLSGGILATNLLKFFSPKSVMLFGMFAQIVCGNVTGLVKHYALHVFFRCLSAVSCAQMYTAGQVIFTDITSGKPRTIITTCFEQFWSVGLILLPGLYNLVNSWSQLYTAISMPTLILVFLWRWIPNSPRWLIMHGYTNEAKSVLLDSVDVNERKHLIPGDLDELLQRQSEQVQSEPPPANWWSLWSGPKAVRHMICVHLIWSIYVPIYYGMLLNVRGFSRDHLEINTVVAALCEITGVFIGLAILLKTERKWLWTGLFNIIAGCISYCCWLVPPTLTGNIRVVTLMAISMISKAAISSTLAILATCTIELVPMEKRKICSFSTTVWARLWLLTAPYMGATVVFGRFIPQTLFASLSILGGFITMLISSPRTIPKSMNKVDDLPIVVLTTDKSVPSNEVKS